MISNYLHYQFSLASLLANGDIDIDTWRYAAWNRPIAVCGRHGGWIVDSTFDMSGRSLNKRACIQFFVGLMMIAAAVAWLISGILSMGFNGAAPIEVIKTALLIGLGLVLALDAALHMQPIRGRRHADLP